MTINVERSFEHVTLEITGRLDATTSPNLEKTVCELPDSTLELVFDVTGLEYISSAGIRVLLQAYKRMRRDAVMRVAGANETVRELLDIAGLSELITV